MAINGENWFQLIIRDQGRLSGESVKSFVAPIAQLIDVNYVLVADLVGAIEGLSSKNGQILCWRDFLTKVGTATQYDWAFFYMYKNKPELNGIDDDRKLIAGSDITIRLVDSGYFYVYGKSESLLKYLSCNYAIVERKIIASGTFEIPY